MTWWKCGDDEWRNYLGEQTFLPEQWRKPKTEDEVSAIVAAAFAQGKRVHFAGAGHASSSLVPCVGWLIDGVNLSGTTRLDDGHVRVLAGTRIKTLNAELDAMDLAMKNLGSATFQSIAGAIATGTHGSGLGFGSLADLVRSVDVVDGSGTRWRIEPASKPFTTGALPKTVTLRLDDDLFHSVVVGVGVCGLVTSLVLEVEPAFLLEEERRLTTWEAIAIDSDLDAEIADEKKHVEIWLNPYVTEGHSAIVTVRSKAASGARLNPRVDPWPLRHEIIRQLVTWALDAFPWFVPQALALAMKSQATTGKPPWVDHSYGIFDLGSINDMPALATEWFFPFDEWRDAVQTMLDEARKLSLRPRAIGGVPFGVRFVKASPHLLAMNHGKSGERFCTIELPVYDHEHDRKTLLRGYEHAASKHGGRPHWGQAHHPQPHKQKRRYPHYGTWKKIRHELDPKETFANLGSHREGFTKERMLHPIVARRLDYYDDSKPRVVLPYIEGRTTHVDRRRFDVHASANDFVDAFQTALLQPGALVANKFEVLRERDREGDKFVVDERFQGRFAIDKQVVQDTRPRPAWWAIFLRELHVDRILQLFEDQMMSNYGQVKELSLPHRIEYEYLTGTPFAGNSLFTVEEVDDEHCRYTEQITFQPTNDNNERAMTLLGLRLHNQVVFGQVESACELLDCHYTPLDPFGTDKPNVK